MSDENIFLTTYALKLMLNLLGSKRLGLMAVDQALVLVYWTTAMLYWLDRIPLVLNPDFNGQIRYLIMRFLT